MEAHSLIPVFTGTLNDHPSLLVNARELHRFLEINAHFRSWVTRRINEYGFIQDEDFRSFLGESSGGRRSREFHITLDMAKELAMVERNERGKQARRYFIECEKKLRTLDSAVADNIAESTIGTSGMNCLSGLVSGKVKHLPINMQRSVKHRLWAQLHKAFSVVSARDIPANQLDAARNFIAAYSIDGEYLPKPSDLSRLSDDLLRSLFLVHEHVMWVVSRYQTEIQPALHAIQYRNRHDFDQHLSAVLRSTHDFREHISDQWQMLNLHPRNTQVTFHAHEITWHS